MDWEIHGGGGAGTAEIVVCCEGLPGSALQCGEGGGFAMYRVILGLITCVCGGNTSQLTFLSVFPFLF